jgi:hypothetical protein
MDFFDAALDTLLWYRKGKRERVVVEIQAERLSSTL